METDYFLKNLTYILESLPYGDLPSQTREDLESIKEMLDSPPEKKEPPAHKTRRIITK